MLFTINDEIVCLWQYDYIWRMRNANMDPSKATPSGPQSWADRACLRVAPSVTQTQLNITSFLLYGSPFLFMILAVSYRKYRKKNWLLKNYYSSKLSFGHVGLLASKGQTPLSVDSNLLVFWLLYHHYYYFFFCKTKAQLRNVTESEYKKKCTSV